jgi:tetratricopeptide (TPR) repeat protein
MLAVMKVVFTLLSLSTSAALACAPVDDQDDRQSALFAQIQSAPTEMAAQAPAAELWEIWLKAPDARAQDLLMNGLERLRIFDFEGAIQGFDALIAYCPEYAEGYNQRAYANYLRQDYDAALPDLDSAIARAPRHVGALSGRALTLLAMGREPEGQQALRKALELNPWLSERGLLKEPLGQDL